MRKRSKYRPRHVIQDPVSWVVQGLKPLRSLGDRYQLLIARNHSAMAELVQGRGAREHVDVLIGAVNMAESFYRVRSSLGRDWAPEIRAAQDALMAMAHRGIERGGRFVFTGPELRAMNLLLDIHDQQLHECTIAQLDDAVELAQREIMHGRARVINSSGAACGS